MEDVIPSTSYLDVIKKGIGETYPDMTEEQIDVYLIERYLNKVNIKILTFIRKQAHGVPIHKIAIDLSMNTIEVISGITDLKETGLIKQDGNNSGVGIMWNAADAVYYTKPERRKVIDKVIENIFVI